MTIHKDLGRRTLIMGILNVTPDSFSDGGKYTTVERAVEHARRLIAEGADILDVGGESTRPGYVPVTDEEEIARVVPVLEALRRDGIDVPISIDTYKSAVAEAALAAGATIVNDIWGGKKDPRLLEAAARRNAPVVLTHNRDDMNYGPDFVVDVYNDLSECVWVAKAAGIPDDRIILDPGIGFAKTRRHNLELLNRLEAVASLGFPVLLGTSRKRFIRDILDAGPEDVVEGTIATTALGVQKGVSIVRVHDVGANAKAARMADAIVRSGEEL
ncbi:dihydropteroate synthase [Paenibacillus antri]|uniref:Dihydropteroate synthase n=1 Tax=Paenibacillus antri TaxID=2582848 RepID=A0A5R9FX98_9BACL|nr:dihydropteroate synthase [Paenibacillus antri]TLS48627.1 dihydropteroate synthase [Paenibacillus antri]